MASKHDFLLKRTIGVITKCDITQDKNQILSLAQNEEKHLNHGWFVVRNRKPEEIKDNISAAERHYRETSFFDSDPWTKLPGSRRGIQALKKYLADLLCKRIQEIFPSILETVKRRQAATSTEMAKMGPARNTTEEKRTHLTAFAQQLYSLTSQALRGRYQGLTHDALKIRKHIREANDAFALKMRFEGHCVPFQMAPPRLEDRKHETPSHNEKSYKPLTSATINTVPPGSGLFAKRSPKQTKPTNHETGRGPFSWGPSPFGASARSSASLFGAADRNSNGVFGQSQSPSNASAVSPLGLFSSNSAAGQQPSRTPTPERQILPKVGAWPDGRSSQIYTWIREEINNCRGTELQGTLNPDVLPALFHRQVAKWKDIATSHFFKTTVITGMALELALESIYGADDIVAHRIRVQVRQVQKAAEAQGLLQIRQRIDEINTRHLQTQNPIFEEQIRKARLTRFTAALERYRFKRPSSTRLDGDSTENEIVVDLRDVAVLFDQIHMSNAQNLEDDVHDILKSYYELALRDFIEYVNQHVVESYLTDPEGPVMFFNPTYVSRLPQERIAEIGAEDAEMAAKREELQARIERLNRAEAIALKYS
ncbi:MAG: hypothetical protein Q9172_004345 [Xanthocarpia lactea]